MKVYRGLDAYPRPAAPAVVTLGNFDGVHLGHQAILRRMQEARASLDAPTLVVTFDPHPLAVLAPDRKPPLIQTPRQKLQSLEAAGVDAVLILQFEPELATLAPETFLESIVFQRLRPAAVVIGENFRFGRGRRGDVDLLGTECRRRGVPFWAVPPVEVDGDVVSSTRIRRLVAEGRVEAAARLLGRPFALEGVVREGTGRGRRLHFPTANLDVENELLPARGVYVTEARVLASRHPSVTNVGVRPTFGGQALTVEAHLLGFQGTLYGERLELAFLARIRDEMRFPDAGALADQIARDVAAAESYFQNVPSSAP